LARRFIVDNQNIKSNGNEIIIFGDEVRHIQVLRYNIGDEIHVNSNIYKITHMSRNNITMEYLRQAEIIGIPSTKVTLYIAFLKSDKMEYVVQKAVEIGVSKIVPFFSCNVIVKLDEKDKIKRREKLQKVADEACKQCGRTDTVEITQFINFEQLQENFSNEESVIFAYEASKNSLRNVLNNCKRNKLKKIGIVIGPEGGFNSKEAEELKNIKNVSCVSLGTRILRAETAVVNLLSITLYELEE